MKVKNYKEFITEAIEIEYQVGTKLYRFAVEGIVEYIIAAVGNYRQYRIEQKNNSSSLENGLPYAILSKDYINNIKIADIPGQFTYSTKEYFIKHFDQLKILFLRELSDEIECDKEDLLTYKEKILEYKEKIEQSQADYVYHIEQEKYIQNLTIKDII